MGDSIEVCMHTHNHTHTHIHTHTHTHIHANAHTPARTNTHTRLLEKPNTLTFHVLTNGLQTVKD